MLVTYKNPKTLTCAKVPAIGSFRSIYLKILMSSRFTGIRLINKSCFSVIDKTAVAICLEVSEKA